MTHRHAFKKPQEGDKFKFCRCGKRKIIHSIVKERKGLKRKAEALWREFAHKRDGEVCQIKRYFPELNLTHSQQMQVDHFFPRADKNLFFDPSNATILCSVCNYLKSNGSPQSTSINMAVREIVSRREGPDKFEEMCQVNNSREPNRDFGRAHYFRFVIEDLERRIRDLGACE